MTRNAIESEFQTSKVADGSHFVKHLKIKLHIDLKRPEGDECGNASTSGG